MKFKSLNDFVTESSTQVINEAKEKFKISNAKITNKNGEAAFVVKYVGPDFDQTMLETFMTHDPISAPSLQKVKENPAQYFFIYRTINAGDPRFLAPNTKKWATYLELINSKSADGKQIYVNFNKPPYNNFVKWTDAEKLINTQDPEVIATGKQIVGSVNQAGTQQAQQGLTDIEKSIAANAQQFQKTGQIPGQTTQPISGGRTPEQTDMINRLIDSLLGLGVGSRGPRVDLLQRTIDVLAKATGTKTAQRESEASLKDTGQFDDIFRRHTANSLYLLLTDLKLLELTTVPTEIDANIVAKLKELLAKHPEIKPEQLTSKDKIDKQLLKEEPPKKETTQPIKPEVKKPEVKQPATQPQILAAAPRTTTHEIVTNIGKIKF